MKLFVTRCVALEKEFFKMQLHSRLDAGQTSSEVSVHTSDWLLAATHTTLQPRKRSQLQAMKRKRERERELKTLSPERLSHTSNLHISNQESPDVQKDRYDHRGCQGVKSDTRQRPAVFRLLVESGDCSLMLSTAEREREREKYLKYIGKLT